jgi:hypothetical protein
VTIPEVIQKRKIIEAVHFTTHTGLLGTLHSRALKSRERLPGELDLKYIYKPNADFRKDTAWLDHVNLSISHINSEFFNVSCRWHRARDLWWCILAFDPIILTHEGVYFTTTNNMYTGVTRGTGASGLDRLFGRCIERWTGNTVVRAGDLPDCMTTCVQAEALYPGEVPIKFLKRIYVLTGEDQDEVHAQMNVYDLEGVEVLIDPAKFGRVRVRS